ncbi:MAG: hypothetical protein IT340_19340 [Chloroflexi bacterium]|nr:hypothetical protein [Chloroflexota bacterium]
MPPARRPLPRWRRRLLYWRLRARAWWVWRMTPGSHPIAEMVARGEWAALDRLLALTDADEWP